MGNKNRIHVSKAIKVLEENYLEILTVYEWADALGYSRFHFCRIFKKKFGLSPKDKLKAFRLKLIKKEVQKSPDAIAYEIAISTGLADKYHFVFGNGNSNGSVFWETEISISVNLFLNENHVLFLSGRITFEVPDV